jgi:uncharacterized protein (DUF58 family)
MLNEIEQRARELQIACHQPVVSMLAGEYRSVFKGVGLEFDQIREYAPGDDVRLIDWKVTARTGHAYIKQYIEDRQLTLWLLVDASASFLIGEEESAKAAAAAEICALLGFSAVANHDRVGLALFTDRIELVERPRRGTGQMLRLIERLLAFTPPPRKTDVGAALDEFHAHSGKHEIVFLISDFQSPPFDLALRRARLRQSLHAICIEHEQEQTLPRVGLLRLQDSETREICVVDTDSASVQTKFAAAVVRRVAARSEKFASADVDLLELTTGDDCAETLRGFLEMLRWKGGARNASR